ncbi:DNA-binding transcriptional regulator [Alteromonas sp. BL110]|jgi:putative transcriptional regulator|uniref:helix-turn-helix domain-containing protein n=1 Tax=unclassified Alteromonas TaxID=2614992 RepID=UPI0008FF760F|nr:MULTISPECIES: DNA-binding transcriptional regulator [unclassified Alteromonas]AXT38470.1 DNA-binding transcriptional regulator [Alteromonas sp. BL110]OJF69979.1 transcriptional regulator [Alteromonas sp. V450]RKM83786.1 DNA-binding transcriptional regulator [Alteromonas sp. BL110]
MKESILDVVHSTAKDLSEAGVMDKQTMHKFDALCLPKLKQYDGQRIKAIREKARVSQAVFAAYLNITPSTIKQWEQGNKKPRGTSLKLLSLVEQKGLEILM